MPMSLGKLLQRLQNVRMRGLSLTRAHQRNQWRGRGQEIRPGLQQTQMVHQTKMEDMVNMMQKCERHC